MQCNVQIYHCMYTYHYMYYNSSCSNTLTRVPTAQGKQGKWPKKIPVRENTANLEILSKHREFGNFVKTQEKQWGFCLNTGKTQGILLAQVVNVLILKVKDIAIVAAKKLFFFQKLDRSAKSVLCM